MIRKTLTEYLCIDPQRMIDFPCFFRYNLLLYVYKKN